MKINKLAVITASLLISSFALAGEITIPVDVTVTVPEICNSDVASLTNTYTGFVGTKPINTTTFNLTCNANLSPTIQVLPVTKVLGIGSIRSTAYADANHTISLENPYTLTNLTNVANQVKIYSQLSDAVTPSNPVSVSGTTSIDHMINILY